jgi:hypothetical protein
MACPENSHATSPTRGEVIASCKTRPFAACIPVIYNLAPTSHLWSTAIEVLTPTTLTKIEGVFHEQAMAIYGAMACTSSASCAHDAPSISSVAPPKSEQHASVTTVLKHLKPCQMPSTTEDSGCLPIAPAMQAIIVDRVTVIYPQLAAVVRDDAESVAAGVVNSCSSSPTHGKMIASSET